MKPSLADALFALDAEIHPFLHINRARSILRSAVAPARPLLYYNRTVRAGAVLVARVVFRDLRIRCLEDDFENDFSLTSVLIHRRASCLGVAVASLAVADFLHVPVQSVLYGRHYGLRFGGRSGVFDVEPPCRPHGRERAPAGPPAPGDYGTLLTPEHFLAILRERRAAPRAEPPGRGADIAPPDGAVRTHLTGQK
jgi:hypothetical protein